jgi:hypothetical protein
MKYLEITNAADSVLIRGASSRPIRWGKRQDVARLRCIHNKSRTAGRGGAEPCSSIDRIGNAFWDDAVPKHAPFRSEDHVTRQLVLIVERKPVTRVTARVT